MQFDPEKQFIGAAAGLVQSAGMELNMTDAGTPQAGKGQCSTLLQCFISYTYR